MIVLTGMSCSGKSAILKALQKLGYERIITYTTRPPRRGEKDGVDYYFISDRLFNIKSANNEFAEVESFQTTSGTWHYGSRVWGYLQNDKSAIILTPKGVRAVKNKYPKADIPVFYIETPEFVRYQRMKNRGDNKQEAARRRERDKEDFKDIEQIMDYKIVNDGSLSVRQIAKKIATIHEQTKNRRAYEE